jgi:CarD family transcriptional regulator
MPRSFQKDEYVFYASGGICKILDIQYAPLEGMPADREYYVMRSIHDKSGMIYVPKDNENIFIRPLLSAECAESLLSSISQVLPIIEENGKLLRSKYLEAMQKHDPSEWVRIIKTAYHRKKEFPDRIQRLSEGERDLVARAKCFLYTELSLALDLHEKEMAERMEQALLASL